MLLYIRTGPIGGKGEEAELRREKDFSITTKGLISDSSNYLSIINYDK
jgi:hypothetical protein